MVGGTHTTQGLAETHGTSSERSTRADPAVSASAPAPAPALPPPATVSLSTSSTPIFAKDCEPTGTAATTREQEGQRALGAGGQRGMR
jgi:hypothetical protein